MISSWVKIFILYASLSLICVLALFNTTNAQTEDDEGFEVYLAFTHRGIINSVVVSYYKDDAFFLPINDLFRIFEIQADQNGLVISGRFSVEQTRYSIDLQRQIIRFGDDTFQLNSEDFLIKELDFYLHPSFFNEVFGLDFQVDFNSLTLSLATQKELPLVQRILRERKRQRVQNSSREISFYELRSGRERKFLDGGFLDYSLSSNISPNDQVYSFNNSIGLQLIGGDLQGSIFGSYSQNSSSLITNNLRWNYVVRDKPAISRITLGQSTLDGALPNPYTGIRISNGPIEARRFFDEFEVEGSTFPESEVEVYLNNTLIDFQKTDALGNYRFLTPVYYGSSQLDIKIYGPTGQVSERASRIQVPFSFVPAGELNYKLNAGILDNPIIGSTKRNLALQGNAAIGITNWLTSKVGVEYFENGFESNIPSFTANISARALSNYILTFEGVSSAYYRFLVNAVYPSSASINVDFTNFESSRNIYNTSGNDQQLIANIFYPILIGNTPVNVRTATFTRFRDQDNFTTFRFDLSTRIKKLSFRLGYADRLINSLNVLSPTGNSTIESSASYNFSRSPSIPKFIRGSFFRGQISYIPKQRKIESAQFLVSKNIFNTGRFQLSVGRNFMTEFNSIRFNLIFDFKKVRSNTTISQVNNSFSSVQNFRGSIGYDSNYKNFILSSRNQVGRSATAVRLFVDNNANAVFDEGDDTIPNGDIRVGRGGTSQIVKNDVLYYSQMQSYYQYNLEMMKSSLENPMLVPEFEKFSIITDPNTFKKIEIPFYMSGIIEGLVERQNLNNSVSGIGGLKLFLNGKNRDFSKELRTFSDGSFYQYELPPGEYEVYVDPAQLELLNVTSSPQKIDFTVNPIPEGDFIEGLKIRLIPKELEQETPEDSVLSDPVAELTLFDVSDEIKLSPEVVVYEQQLITNVEKALRLIILTQNAFYERDFGTAFQYINESLQSFETAQGYALKGSIQYFQGDRTAAVASWRMALRFDPDIYIPTLEALDQKVTVSSSE